MFIVKKLGPATIKNWIAEDCVYILVYIYSIHTKKRYLRKIKSNI